MYSKMTMCFLFVHKGVLFSCASTFWFKNLQSPHIFASIAQAWMSILLLWEWWWWWNHIQWVEPVCQPIRFLRLEVPSMIFSLHIHDDDDAAQGRSFPNSQSWRNFSKKTNINPVDLKTIPSSKIIWKNSLTPVRQTPCLIRYHAKLSLSLSLSLSLFKFGVFKLQFWWWILYISLEIRHSFFYFFPLLIFPLTSKSSFEEASDHYKRKRKFF